MKILQSTRSLPTLALVAGLAAGAGFLLQKNTVAGPAPTVRDNARALSQAFREVARHISPSVVGILATKEATDMPSGLYHRFGQGQGDNPLEEPLRRFFGNLDGSPFWTPVPAPTLRGQGTGVIVQEDGVIATNNHVVAGASEIEVTLQDGRKLPAKVIGTDPETDLALLRVQEKGLPAATLGDSKELEPGEWVVAVGNPFGLDHSVTVGVVSAIGRSGIGVANYEDFIQTDAAINPGNSGGPLLNLDGEVVGINTAIRTSNGGSDGISFAVPSATLARVMPDLVADGRVSRGWLGVSLQPLTEELARSFGADSDRGALISQVFDDTPASRAGLRSGDIVTTVQGKDVRDVRALSDAIAALEPSTEAKLGVLRDGKSLEIVATLAERPAKDAIERQKGDEAASPLGFGLRLTEVPRNMTRELDLPGGALVREVVPNSPADEAGLRPGDVILSVGSHDVRSADEALDLLRDARAGTRLLVHAQDGSTRWIFLARGARD